MSYPFPVSLLDIDRQPGKAPIVRAEAPGDGLSWVAEHRDALRAAVAEHGSVMVRGLDLHNAPEVSAVFRRLATGLMTERERPLRPGGSTPTACIPHPRGHRTSRCACTTN
jgi:hypothetical protein